MEPDMDTSTSTDLGLDQGRFLLCDLTLTVTIKQQGL